ncbi:hypothetical protein [Shimazuella kribbensis]|uniref:hypothetical protein n=1 Tax=Shimazuella kribbensis TaxID=139808 RepID=UPI00048CAFCC|nr:hypothetical protein [Shimazuella kribbensis]
MTNTSIFQNTTSRLSEEIKRATDDKNELFKLYDEALTQGQKPEPSAELPCITARKFLLIATRDAIAKNLGDDTRKNFSLLLAEASIGEYLLPVMEVKKWSDVAEQIHSFHSNYADIETFIKQGYSEISDDVREIVHAELSGLLGKDFGKFLK